MRRDRLDQRGAPGPFCVARDIFPTINAIAGNSAVTSDGESLAPVLLGGSLTRSMVYAELFNANFDPTATNVARGRRERRLRLLR